MKYDERTCKFNMDTGCVELLLRDGRMISIDCTGVEDELDVTIAQRSELDYLIYMLKDYPPFQANDFEYLRGRILILLPENDIFKKEDQKRFADLFRKLDAEIRTVPGGHVGFIVQAERYLDLMETFLQRNGI